MGDMIVVTHQELQRMLTGLQTFQPNLGLSATEVQIMSIGGYGLIEGREVRIEDQVMVTDIWHIRTFGRYTRTTQTHTNP